MVNIRNRYFHSLVLDLQKHISKALYERYDYLITNPDSLSVSRSVLFRIFCKPEILLQQPEQVIQLLMPLLNMWTPSQAITAESVASWLHSNSDRITLTRGVVLNQKYRRTRSLEATNAL